jgi:protein-S-isoprenylcysteine O-methyltransferase Ste14
VRTGFLLAAIYLVWAQPTPQRLVAGCAVALAGILLRGWSAGHLEKERKLTTSGPYGHTRNPLYLGSAVAALGFAIAAGQWWYFLLLGFFLGAVYWPVIRYEEGRLAKLFPDEFPTYARAVPALWPRVIPWREGQGVFRWEQYRRNREYRAFLGSVAIVLFLIARMYLFRAS